MIYFELVDKNGDLVHSTIKNSKYEGLFADCKTETCKKSNCRQVYKKYNIGSVRILGQADDDALVTAKIANRTADVYSSLLATLLDIKKQQEIQYSIFSHNLITTHSRLQDEIASIIPEEKLARALTYNEQVAEVRSAIESDVLGTSESIFEIAKRIIDLQSQITGFKVLSGEIKPNIFPQNIKKVLLNIIYPYYEDFRKINVDIKLYIEDAIAAGNLLPLDYKLFNIAIHHFLNNALKYSYPDSHIDIRFDVSSKTLSFDMISLRIEEFELETIFELKVSGTNAKGIPGDGIGMYMLQKALKLLEANMKIQPDYTFEKWLEGKAYHRNIFYINFKT